MGGVRETEVAQFGAGVERKHSSVLPVIEFLIFLFLFYGVLLRMRPLLGEEKEGLEEIRHVNIQTEKNLELIKTVDGANESIAGGLNKNMK